MRAVASRRMTIPERRDFLDVMRAEGWLTAGLDDTPRYVAKSGSKTGWGYDRESAICDMEDLK